MDSISQKNKRSTTLDMTAGSIPKLLLLFVVPLLLGNLFQLLYNTIDALVVGNFVGKDALAAVGSTTSIINIAVFFFNGMSVGGGVVISQYFGARESDKLHRAVETTMVMTFVFSVFLTIAGVQLVPFMLRFMKTPEDVMGPATTYLRIYFSGISGLLIYNMASGILRAVGDTRRPLLFLIFCSFLNIVLDLLFVIGFGAGIEGVGYATILSQFISAAAVLTLLSRSRDVYRLTWKDLRPDWSILSKILQVGLPAGLQAMITSFSNVFVQSYINVFGSDCMAGWSCYDKLNQFAFLPILSMANAATTFVSQNIGARQLKRAQRGTVTAILLSMSITAVTAVLVVAFAPPLVGVFNQDPAVIDYGVLFVRMNMLFLVFNTVNNVMAGALRGFGDAKAPMVIMISTFVGVRQLYLYTMTHYVVNSARVVGFGYPVGWMACCVIEVLYFRFRWHRKVNDDDLELI